MSDWRREFEIAKTAEPDYEKKALAFRREMMAVLEGLTSREIPCEDYDRAALDLYVRSLIENQGKGDGRFKAGGWFLLDDELAPSEIRVEYGMLPTCMAIATLVRYREGFDDRVHGTDGAIAAGCTFASLRDLQGHGYNGNITRLQALGILALGRVPEYLAANPDVSPELLGLLGEIKDEVLAKFQQNPGYFRDRKGIPPEDKYLGWGAIDPWFEIEALGLLYPVPSKNSPDVILRQGNPAIRAIVDAPHATPPDADSRTGQMAWEISTRTGCSVSVSCISKKDVNLNRAPIWDRDISRRVHGLYRNGLVSCVESCGILDPSTGRATAPYLHLALHGMSDDHSDGNDMVTGTLEGARSTCTPAVKAWLLERLRAAGFGVADDVPRFSGDPSLALHVHGDPPAAPPYPGFGRSYNLVQLEISRKARDEQYREIVDLLSAIVTEFSTREWS